MQPDDVVRLINPMTGYPDPLGHVRTITGDGNALGDCAYVERDDGKGTEPFLIRELEVVDVDELEKQLAASNAAPADELRPWVCKCERRNAARVVVCPNCGRMRPRVTS